MKKLNIKRAVLSALIVWTLGVSLFVASYYVVIMDDADMQANFVLSLGLIPLVAFAAHFYYGKGNQTNGFLVGTFMFFCAIILDAGITVPVLIAPLGGDHLSFFGDPGFWLIGVEYIVVVAIYDKFKNSRSLRSQTVN